LMCLPPPVSSWKQQPRIYMVRFKCWRSWLCRVPAVMWPGDESRLIVLAGGLPDRVFESRVVICTACGKTHVIKKNSVPVQGT
jgi:hypothetical protein